MGICGLPARDTGGALKVKPFFGRFALALMPQASAIRELPVVYPDKVQSVTFTTRLAALRPKAVRGKGHVLPRSSCQCQTRILHLLGSRPRTASCTIYARHTYFCGALRFAEIAFSRLPSKDFVIKERFRRKRFRHNEYSMHGPRRISAALCESPDGFKY